MVLSLDIDTLFGFNFACAAFISDILSHKLSKYFSVFIDFIVEFIHNADHEKSETLLSNSVLIISKGTYQYLLYPNAIIPLKIGAAKDVQLTGFE